MTRLAVFLAGLNWGWLPGCAVAYRATRYGQAGAEPLVV